MKNNKVFLSIIAALGLSVSAMSAQAAVISVTTGSNPYYQYQQQNLGAVQTQSAEPESLPESPTNIQARQRMQTMNQQSTQMNSNDPSAQAYSQAANINGNAQGQYQQQGQGQTQNQQQQGQQDTGPKNAYEQGFGQEQANADRQAALEDWISNQSARQQGETIPVPKPLNVVANDKSSRIWLINWKGVLVEQVGLKPEKVDFEASRLNKEDFAAWASRQVRYVEPNAIAVNP